MFRLRPRFLPTTITALSGPVMLLAGFPSAYPATSLTRSITFPKPVLSIAKDNQVGQETRRIPPNTTAPVICSKKQPTGSISADTMTTTRIDTTAAAKGAPTKECPTCKGTGSAADHPPKASAVDIDGEVEDKFNQLPLAPVPAPKPHRQFVHCMPPLVPTYRKFSVFTAGSIEMGKAVQWQKLMATKLSHLPITVNNPRRGHWDPSATQEAKNNEFRHQVEWELSALEQADVICFFFDVNTMSPVTMLELGLWAASKKVVVCCDKRFWRGGNVDLVCQRYNIPLVKNFAELVPAVEAMLKSKGMELDQNGDLIGSNEHVPKEIKKMTLSS